MFSNLNIWTGTALWSSETKTMWRLHRRSSCVYQLHMHSRCAQTRRQQCGRSAYTQSRDRSHYRGMSPSHCRLKIMITTGCALKTFLLPTNTHSASHKCIQSINLKALANKPRAISWTYRMIKLMIAHTTCSMNMEEKKTRQHNDEDELRPVCDAVRGISCWFACHQLAAAAPTSTHDDGRQTTLIKYKRRGAGLICRSKIINSYVECRESCDVVVARIAFYFCCFVYKIFLHMPTYDRYCWLHFTVHIHSHTRERERKREKERQRDCDWACSSKVNAL